MMSGLDKMIDLTMFGCPMHKIKALQAAKNLQTPGEFLLFKVNTDGLKTIQNYLEENGFQCRAEQQDTLTSLIRVSK